ncbi:hypothetical protein FQA39_LY01370 [Lamprigera yunnana]|nr:hypothetical protein FQA39_LY01370 [Lamprigera yunnana]
MRLIFFWLVLKMVRGAEENKNESFPINFDFAGTIPTGDFIGDLVKIINNLFDETQKGRSPPKSANCKRRLIKFGENEFQLSVNPLGWCSYCCQFVQPTNKYIRLVYSNKDSGQLSKLDLIRKKGILFSAGFNSDYPSVMYIPGFGEYGLSPSSKQILEAYLSREEGYNIFTVDWGDLSTFPWYPQAKNNTQLVGYEIAQFLRFYNDIDELPIAKLHVIGFSLGAQVAGYIGRYLKNYRKLPWITALDAALPLFSESECLSKEDAVYVDAIHTDGGKFGFIRSLGHADFFPNGGSFVQPGCEVSGLAEEKIIDQLGYCGHLRSWKLYVESVRNPKAFPSTTFNIRSNRAVKFVTEAYMGFGINPNTTRGNFYLITNGKYPYSKGPREQEKEMRRG